MSLVLGIIVTVVVLVVLSGLGLVRMEGLGSAVLAALLLGVFPGVIWLLLAWSNYPVDGMTLLVAIHFLDNLIALALVGMFAGLSFSGVGGFVLTAVVLAALDVLLPFAIANAPALA